MAEENNEHYLDVAKKHNEKLSEEGALAALTTKPRFIQDYNHHYYQMEEVKRLVMESYLHLIRAEALIKTSIGKKVFFTTSYDLEHNLEKIDEAFSPEGSDA